MPNKILLIDDDLLIRDSYKEVLTSEGFEVETAADGNEGYEKIAGGGFDIVLLDVMLPKLDGIGILTKLGENNLMGKNKRILLLTNLAHDPAVKEALKLGAEAVITKASIAPDKLVAYLKSLTGEQVTAKKASEPEPKK